VTRQTSAKATAANNSSNGIIQTTGRRKRDELITDAVAIWTDEQPALQERGNKYALGKLRYQKMRIDVTARAS
jgi:hypothetical protein